MLSAEAFRAIVSGEMRGPIGFSVRGLLSCAEWPYATAMKWRNRRFDRGHAKSFRIDVPVISIGNVTLGGTGKTPLVAWLAKWFREQQIRVSIISRGYGAGTESRNDEAKELEARLPDVPHLQNPDRYAAARVAVDELETQLILLDDGFQHRRLQRDLDLVLIDATEPFGYDHVFPRGTLREPLQGLKRAHAIMLTRCNLVDDSTRAAIRRRVQQVAPQACWLEAEHDAVQLCSASGATTSLEALASRPVAAFCGIGNPTAFRQTLTNKHFQIDRFREFPDHHNYSREDLESLQSWLANSNSEAAICTHKDLVKLAVERLGSHPLWALMIDLQISSGQPELEKLLQQVLQRVS